MIHLLNEMVAACGTAVVAATRRAGASWHGAAGYESIEERAGVTDRHRFRVGSVTKVCTAAATLCLVENGALSLDAPLVDIGMPLPRVTTRQLLQMTSGLADYVPALVGDPPDLSQFLRKHEPEALLRLGLTRRQPSQVGEFNYSNTNYVVLGMVIEAITGQPWAHVLRRRVLEPLHLTATDVPETADLPCPHPQGYLSLSKGQEPMESTEVHPSESGPSGAIVSTADEILTVVEAFVAGDLISSELRSEALRSVPTGLPGRSYGLGLAGIELADGRVAWGHGGGVPGFMAFVYATTDRDGVSVLRNHYAEWANLTRWNQVAEVVLGPRRFPF